MVKEKKMKEKEIEKIGGRERREIRVGTSWAVKFNRGKKEENWPILGLRKAR